MKAAILCLVVSLALAEAHPVSDGSGPTKPGLCGLQNHTKPLIGQYVPQCDADGNFDPRQCWASTGECWCVNPLTGVEIPGTRTGPGEEPVHCEVDSHCPPSWTHYDDRCYIFIDSPKSWVEAESYCLFEEGNLASVHSYEENHFLQTLSRAHGYNFPQTWVGGTNAVKACFWMWSDGSRFLYENWFDDDAKELEDSCLKINYGYQFKWDSGSCNDSLPFICSKEIEDD